MALDDLTGRRFGRLVVIGRAPNHICPGGSYAIAWNCVCDCGNHVVVLANSLRNGNNKSCGCYRKEYRIKHNMRNTRLYNIWANMRQRCNNTHNRQYADYGGRGITICDEWAEFETFYEWAMASSYNDSLSIDRIDNNGGYSPDNCRWASNATQSNNRRSCVNITYRGETKTLAQWAKALGMSDSALRTRLRKGWSLEKALTTPIRRW